MSPRNFARVFTRETGITPAKYVEKLRLEAACRLLTETQHTLETISLECGLMNIDNMRRLFIKHLKVTPSDYRRQPPDYRQDNDQWIALQDYQNADWTN